MKIKHHSNQWSFNQSFNKEVNYIATELHRIWKWVCQEFNSNIYRKKWSWCANRFILLKKYNLIFHTSCYIGSSAILSLYLIMFTYGSPEEITSVDVKIKSYKIFTKLSPKNKASIKPFYLNIHSQSVFCIILLNWI